MRKLLITGIAGFVGSHLAERMMTKAEVWGVHIDEGLDNLVGMGALNLLPCDLMDGKGVAEVFKRVRPGAIVHLAAQSRPALSFDNPAETLRNNIFSTLNVFEAAASVCPEAVILNIGSGDVYGEVNEAEFPVRETAELRPMNPYSVSKATADLMGFQYWKSKGLRVIRCRPFNHLGPRQARHFVAPSFARQIAECEAGARPDMVIKVGNLESSKDFLDVRDVVAAYELLLDKGACGEAYNICSGKAVKIRWILDTLLSLSAAKIEVSEDAGKMRPTEAMSIYGDAGKLRALGWEPRYPLVDGLAGLLDYWRGKTRARR
ncbi:MAG: GDP-mannose 4,6-dehydratase [Deltaproteobacteria bacterium]|nr:GDP-mannose 4,6-dehydratase [Deltaproteobacteria bacterium]